MNIKPKIILTVLPLVIVPLALSQAASYFAAVNDISRAAERFLSFKATDLQRYAESQWALLVDNGYAGRADMEDAAKKAVELYARGILTSDTERIFAVDASDGDGAPYNGAILMDVSGAETAASQEADNGALNDGETKTISQDVQNLLLEENAGLMTARIDGVERVFQAFYFAPFRWHVVLSEETAVFYRDVNAMRVQTIITIAAAAALVILLLILLSNMLTKPLAKVSGAMQDIISKGDMSGRVKPEYNDETGVLANTFNLMIGGLESAYQEIKRRAFEAALAQKKEQRIRQIFQKYVPKDIIDRFFASPEKMLVGENRNLSVLFSDIRGFTTISENMRPDDLVNSLNRYFSGQVDIIMNRNGIVDKYIGDAIMAFWGAPVKHEDDVLQSVLSGLDMIDALDGFNAKQREMSKTEFRIGIGINYGELTVGNIGSERKMDYTVIGDTVNLASRLEGLTKMYHADLLISESVFNELRLKEHSLPFTIRLLDTVAVKGKTTGIKIFAVKRNLSDTEEKAWQLHNQGMKLYYSRSFTEAADLFRQVLALLPNDLNAQKHRESAESFAKTPPPPDWNGVEVMHSK